MQEWGDLDIMARMLDGKLMRDITPPEAFPDSSGGFRLREYHKEIERGKDAWRMKYYRPATSDDYYDFAWARAAEGTTRYDFPEWYLIDENARERKQTFKLEGFKDLNLE